MLSSLLSFLCAAGLAAMAAILLAGLVGAPRRLVVWLAGGQPDHYPEPAYIVVLGGGGMPSESGLIRCYFAAEYARRWPSARLVVALPGQQDAQSGAAQKMRDELVLRGVPEALIDIEYSGRNTHEQAAAIRELAGESAADSTVAVVSALIHLRRAVMSFSKAGFTRVYGLPAANVALDADMGRRQFVRYRFWQNLGWSISVVRELLALASYKRRGLV